MKREGFAGSLLEQVKGKASEPGRCHSWDRRQRWHRKKLAGSSSKKPAHVRDFNGHFSSTGPNHAGPSLLLTALTGLWERCLCWIVINCVPQYNRFSSSQL